MHIMVERAATKHASSCLLVAYAAVNQGAYFSIIAIIIF